MPGRFDGDLCRRFAGTARLIFDGMGPDGNLLGIGVGAAECFKVSAGIPRRKERLTLRDGSAHLWGDTQDGVRRWFNINWDLIPKSVKHGFWVNNNPFLYLPSPFLGIFIKEFADLLIVLKGEFLRLGADCLGDLIAPSPGDSIIAIF